jgi:nucleotide-binding universal stress UspA family protein
MKHLLVGLDGSKRAPAVLDAAMTLARSLGGQLTLIRSVGLPPDVPQDFFKSTDQTLLDSLCAGARLYLEGCASTVPRNLLASSGIEVIVGAPWEAVCSTARRVAVDLIVIGSHGYGGIDRLLGTTAAKIVNHAPCSVMVVREREAEPPGGKKTA